MSKTQRFRSIVQPNGKGAIVPVPFDPNEVWGAKERHFITGTIAGFDVRGALDGKGSESLLALGPAWLRDRPLAAGEVEVVLSPEGPQIGELAEDIEAAFAASPQAVAFFNSLATFYRKGFITPIEQSKRPITRATRIAEMITLLEARKFQK